MTESSPKEAAVPLGTGGLVLKNALFLVVAQALTTPISVLINFMMGRFLGPADFGLLYLTGTFCNFAFLAVEWGQAAVLPALVATDRSRSGVILGTALAWRVGTAALVCVALPLLSLALGYERRVAELFAVSAFGLTVGAASNACLDAIRGFERTDVSAYAQVGGAMLNALVVVVTLLAGGGLLLLVAVQGLVTATVFGFVWRMLRPVGVGKLQVDRATQKDLLSRGVPFVMFGLVMALQPNIDAFFMADLLSNEVVGWHAAAKRLIGVLVVPASAIITALYPTLARLWVEDQQSFRHTVSNALRTTAVLAMPLALGCYLYPDVGVTIFGREKFGPAEDNVRFLSPFLFLLYFSMPLGTCLLASGRQKIWSFVQALCVVFSAALDPLLIPFFDRTMQNGGLGVCTANVIAEVFMVGIGVVLAPRGIFDRALARQLGLAVVAGAAMFGTARLLGFLTPFVAAPVAVLVYGGSLWAIGGIDEQQIATFKRVFTRKGRRGQ